MHTWLVSSSTGDNTTFHGERILARTNRQSNIRMAHPIICKHDIEKAATKSLICVNPINHFDIFYSRMCNQNSLVLPAVPRTSQNSSSPAFGSYGWNPNSYAAEKRKEVLSSGTYRRNFRSSVDYFLQRD